MKGSMKFVLCYLVRERDGRKEVALARKKWREGSKNIGVDRYNGYGGSIEFGETERQAILREIRQETGFDDSGVIISTHPDDLQKIAIAVFRNLNEDNSVFEAEVHVYVCSKWEGEPRESEEKTQPEWFLVDALPFSEMMPSDPKWLPRALNGWKVKVFATLRNQQRELVGEVGVQYVRELLEDQGLLLIPQNHGNISIKIRRGKPIFSGASVMMYTLAVIFLIAWLLGTIGGVYSVGPIVHVLLIAAVLLFLLRLLNRQGPSHPSIGSRY